MLFVVLAVAGLVCSVVRNIIPEDSRLEVYFLDVGEGDCAVLSCEGRSMIIDGGDAGSSGYVYSFLKEHDISRLEYMVCTHPDSDHVGGLPAALNFAETERVFCTVKDHDTDTFRSFRKYADEHGLIIEVPSAGDRIHLGRAKVEFLGPYYLSGNSSLVLKVTFGRTSFLFTGDTELVDEKELTAYGEKLDCTLLKVGHHGSDTSSSVSFLDAVRPEYAVISVGGDNPYGHPSEIVLDRLKNAGVKVFRTDMQGMIECVSDGETLTFSVERNCDADTFSAPGGYSNMLRAKRQEEENRLRNAEKTNPDGERQGTDFILNTNSRKFHYPGCLDAEKIKEKNREYYYGTRDYLIDAGFSPCGHCNP